MLLVLEGEEMHSAPHRLVLGVDLLALPLGLLILFKAVLVQAPEVGNHAPVIELGGSPLLWIKTRATSYIPSQRDVMNTLGFRGLWM